MAKEIRWTICLIILLLGSSRFVLADLDADLKEVDSNFTYQGKPIHPFLIEEFINWISDDRPPMIVTVDVAASFDSNKYQNDEIRKDEYGVFAESGDSTVDYKSFRYKWLGKMIDGSHVLEVGSNGGGSGTFMDLIFVRIHKGTFLRADSLQNQILITIVKAYPLGDRYEGDIKVFPDRVFIPASKNQHGGGSADKDIVLR